ncbi:uncharacterized protein N0V96_005298 [Colletotrichum fioriniae]|uniref:uncharacterized protein n=1 Tax=Colletotrichum fioriniae TaxID=710243 RepID=UPI0032DA9E16|nr:hypothetical protein N0V96_005298 [Colletotrichum fioriniae]
MWVPDPFCSAEQKHAHRGTSYRYPLFTEEERKTMSVEIVTSMGRQSAGDIVLDLDEKSVRADDAHVAGPFGVFRAFDGSTDSGSSPLQPSVSGGSPNTSPSDALPETMDGELDEDIEDIVIEPWSVDDNSLALEPYLLPGPFDNFNTEGIMGNMSQPWMHGEGPGNIGQNYQKSAQTHLKKALQGESDEPSQAKYNEILMAILATAMVSVLYNGSRAVKIFLLDAERLIRLRGLAMPKSFHVRVLHHVYTHLRVIAESTDIAIDSAKSQAQAATEMAVSLRKFRIAEDSLGADLDLSREKPAEVGYADIHLDVSGHWPVTMYPEIYGVPESLMTLLSQTISFANEKTKLEAMAMYDHRISMALSRHIKQLEQNIWSWSLGSSDMQSGPSRPRELVTQETKLVDHPLIRSLTLAMHQALIIYFYRRVYNMSAMVIQDSVRKTLDFIQPCLEETADDHDFATSIGWAAFIAACEATAPDLQERGLKVLQTIDSSGVIFGTDKPSVLAQSVWDKRTETGDWTLSWPDMMKTIPR